jgi:hypothetical protein
MRFTLRWILSWFIIIIIIGIQGSLLLGSVEIEEEVKKKTNHCQVLDGSNREYG